MPEWLSEANAAALVGLLGGIALGLAARVGRFCTLGAIEDVLYSSDDSRLRMWGVAVGTAIVAVHVYVALVEFDVSQTAYLARDWNPLATIIGGLLFGYGMALSGNCGYGALARLGGGDLRSLVIVIVMGLSAYFVMSGPLAYTRVWIFPVEDSLGTPQGVSQFIQQIWGIPTQWPGILIGLALFSYAIASRRMFASSGHILWGIVVGLAIASGWIGTHWIAQVGFGDEPIETHTFAAPIGDTMFYAMTASGNALSFSVGSVVGVLLGACFGSYSKGHFRWEACDDPRELRRQIFGAALMGPGAILAVGCSVGQGISAFSVLAFSAPVAFVSIFVGAAIGLRQLIYGLRLTNSRF